MAMTKMTEIKKILCTPKFRVWGAGAAAAAAAFVVAGASGAVAKTAIDVPPQVFDQGQASAKPAVQWRPNAPSWAREPSEDGRSFGVNVPLAGGRLPLTVHLLSSEAQCHDEDITSAGREQDKAFIRGGDLDNGFVHDAR
jgi:hypothetical protein